MLPYITNIHFRIIPGNLHLFFHTNLQKFQKIFQKIDFLEFFLELIILQNKPQKWILRIKIDLQANFQENLSIFQKKIFSENFATCQTFGHLVTSCALWSAEICLLWPLYVLVIITGCFSYISRNFHSQSVTKISWGHYAPPPAHGIEKIARAG